jgi:hypothetical protein
MPNAAIKLDLAAFQSLQQFVLIGCGERGKGRGAQICADVSVDLSNGCPIKLSGAKAALITLLRRTLWPRPAEIIVIAAAKGTGELAIQKERYVCLDSAGADRVVGDQSSNRRFSECRLGRCKKYISGSGGSGRRICCSFLPGHRAANRLRRRAEFTIVNGRGRCACYACSDAAY